MKELLNAYDLFKAGEFSTDAPPVTLREAYTKALQIMINPTFCRSALITELGKLGLSGCVEVEGLIAILHGCDLPVLFRRNPAEANSYVFVEVIYLEDATQGKMVAWTEDQADEFVIV